MITILDILKKELIGKTMRIKILHEAVTQSSLVYVKKSKNVTDKQFADGTNPKFRMASSKSKRIGSRMVFEELKIIDLKYEEDEYGPYIGAILEGGHEANLSYFEEELDIK